MVKVAIGADHAGFELKQKVLTHLHKAGIESKDFGTNSTISVDYPDIIHPLAQSVNDGSYEYGIIICGSGNGVAMTANKYSRIRAAICWNEQLASLARQHNNANILSLPARFISDEMAINIVDAFLNTEFEGGRHKTRVDKISL